MQYDPDELPPPIRPRPTRPRLVNINEERLAERRAAMSSAPGSDVSMETTVILQPLPDEDDDPTQPRMASVRFKPLPVTGEINDINDVDDISEQSTRHLKQLSGMMPAIKLAPQSSNGAIASPAFDSDEQEEGYWPHGIQQTGALPVVNLYGRKPFGQTLPQTPAVVIPASPKSRSAWRVALGSPAAKIVIGLIIGVGLLFLVAHFVDLPTTIAILHQNLATPRGIMLALLSGVAFLLAFSIRGVRWKLFLNPVGEVSTFKAIQLFLVGIFLNFLLPIRCMNFLYYQILKLERRGELQNPCTFQKAQHIINPSAGKEHLKKLPAH